MSLFFSHVEVPTLGSATSVYRDREQEGIDLHDYSALEPKPAHVWTDEHRTILCILVERYSISWSNIKLLFDDLFEAELSSSSGPSTNALRKMYDTLRRRGWYPTGLWKSTCAALEAKADEMGIEITKKDNIVQKGGPNGRRVLLVNSELDSGDESDMTLLGDEYDLPRTPSKYSRNVPTGGALEISQLKSSSNRLRRESRWEIPKLGYRS